MFFYLIRRADRRSKPLTAAQRRQAMAWTWFIAIIIVVIIAAISAG